MVLTLWKVRARYSTNPPNLKEIYSGEPNFFTLKIHHGGMFTKYPGRKYVDGKVDYVDFVDYGVFSVHELNAMMEEIGYVNGETLSYHFLIPGIQVDYGLLPLGNDGDVAKLGKYMTDNKEIKIYIEHDQTRVHTYFMSPSKLSIDELDEVVKSPGHETNKKKPTTKGYCRKKMALDHMQAVVPFVSNERQSNVVEEVEGDNEGLVSEVEGDNEGLGSEESMEGVTENDEINDEGVESDSVFNDDTVVDEVEVNMSEFRVFVEGDATPVDGGDKDRLKVLEEQCHHEELDAEDIDSAGLEENPRKKMLKEGLKDVSCSSGVVHSKPFKVGQTFKDKKQIKALVDLHSVETRRKLYYAKNDKTRLRVKCEGGVVEMVGGSEKGKGKLVISEDKQCPWVLLFSKTEQDEAWTIKTYESEHTCGTARKVRACTAKFLADNIVQQIEGNPNIPVRALKAELTKRYSLEVSRMKVHRAKSIARTYVFGDSEKQYSMLRNYAMELQARNPGTSVKIEVESEPDPGAPTRKFKRIYVCLNALKQGFRAGLREFLGFDGAFVKGPFPGQILSAVGIDSNNGIYPVAYAVVEAEKLETWTWFLQYLADDLDLNVKSNFTFITDRQKGLLQAISNLFPAAEHRFCVRHVYENLKLQWKDKELKEPMWRCAKATNVPSFNRSMLAFKKLNPNAHAWLEKIPPNHWSRAHFSGRAVSDLLLNNLCEVFNSKILDARDKPIITCLEWIREYLMVRLVTVDKEIAKCKGSLTPTSQDILDENKDAATQLKCVFNGTNKYQVTGQWMDQYVVNLQQKYCSCRQWDITGIPCKHAIAAINDKMENGEECGEPEAWVHKCYWLSTWKAMYSHKIEPINGKDMWPQSSCPIPIIPPTHHVQVGRPKKKRTKAADEPSSQGSHLSRKHLTVTCSKCHKKGHNSRSCKGGTDGAEVARASKKKKGSK